MKTTIDIPDEVYRRVKAKSALQGRAIRDVTVNLYAKWLDEDRTVVDTRMPEQWLAEWQRLGARSLGKARPGRTATEVLAEDRSRLEKR